MTLPAMPLLELISDEADADVKAVQENVERMHRYLRRLKESLDNFTPSQVATAFNNGGLGWSPVAPWNGITLPAIPETPDPPTGLEATGFFTEIGLNWDLIPNPFVTGYEVQRADDGAFTTNVITRTTALALSYLDRGLPNSTERFYRIRALTKDPLIFSAFTAPVSATTLSDTSTVLDELKKGVVKLQRAHIGDAVIDNAMIGEGQITHVHILDGTITSIDIGDAQIKNANIENGAITRLKVLNGEIINAHIESCSADKLTAGTIDVMVQLSVAGNAIQLDGVNNFIAIRDTTPTARVKLGNLGGTGTDYGLQVWNELGQLMFSSMGTPGVAGVTPIGLKDLAVISAKLDELAVLTQKIAANAVTNRTVYSVTTAGIFRDGSVHGTSYVDTAASVTITVIGTMGGSAHGDVVIQMVTNMRLASNTGDAQLDYCVGGLRLIKDGGATPLRSAGREQHIYGNNTVPVFSPSYSTDSVIMYYIDRAVTAGAHTYKIQVQAQNANTSVYMDQIDLSAEEIKK